MALTRQQFDELRKNGLSVEQIVNFEKGNKPVVEAQGFGQNLAQGALGFAKGVGRSVLGIGKIVASSPLANPLIGSVPFGQNIAQKAVSKVAAPVEKALEPKNRAQKAGGYIELAAEILGPSAYKIVQSGPALIRAAEGLYLKALKAPTTLSAAERLQLAKTGLREGLTVSQAGVQKMEDQIVKLESKLNSVINENSGKTFKTSLLRPFVEEAKKFLGNTVDVAKSDISKKRIDTLYQNFVKKYGDTIDIQKAQELKVNTYKDLAQNYNKLAAPAIEASKQLARGLKDEILKNVPEVGDVNTRLSSLYNFEDILTRAVNRAGNNNIVSLGGKVLGAGNQSVLAIINELFGPAGKSLSAKAVNRVGQILTKLTPQEQQFVKLLSTYSKTGTTGLIGKIEQLFSDITQEK